MKRIENYLHEFLLVLFANARLIKRTFLLFAALVVLLPFVLSDRYDISAEVIVQSKKVAQTDARSALSAEGDRFLPPTLADMETESNILRSPWLIRETVRQLRDEGALTPDPPGPLHRWVITPLRSALLPLRTLLGTADGVQRDTELDGLTDEAIKNLEVGALPGSNVISIIYAASDPTQGTRFVERLLLNYLEHRQSLQSGELPVSFYEQKTVQYKTRLDELEARRRDLLAAFAAADPQEEIGFQLNAINQEELSLNQFRDQALESQKRLDYLQSHLEAARKRGGADFSFPYAFARTADNIAYEDREIRQLGEQLTTLVTEYGNSSDTYLSDSAPMQRQREMINRTRRQFLQIVENRIAERSNELAITQSVVEQKEARIAAHRERIRDLQRALGQLRQLDTEIDALHGAFFTYTQRFEESRSLRLVDDDQSNARILSPPFEPAKAAFPRAKIIIPLGLVTALLLAIALGYIQEFFDHRFKYPRQISEHLGLPVLMVINAADPVQPASRARGPWQRAWAWIKK